MANVVENLQSQMEKQQEYVSTSQNLITKYKDEHYMNGRWIFRYQNTFRNMQFEETFYIIDGVIHTINGNRTVTTYHIAFFFYDVINKKIVMHLKFIPDTTEDNYIRKFASNVETISASTDKELRTYYRTHYSPVLIHELEVNNESALNGTENVEALITYQKLQ